MNNVTKVGVNEVHCLLLSAGSAGSEPAAHMSQVNLQETVLDKRDHVDYCRSQSCHDMICLLVILKLYFSYFKSL